jgi:predicted unusual protein kinase regulating ubiquinone biosynthesis (AarF/ABC1/UbiB family)
MDKKNKNGAASSSKFEAIMAALPSELDREQFRDSLGDLIEKISFKRVPVGSLSRMWILGSMKAKIALGYLAYMIRSNFAGETEKERRLNETNLRAGLRLLATMGYLRGTIMKIGQVMGNLPEVVPEEIAEIMSTLQFDAPPMHYSMIREVFLDEFGKEPGDIFRSFEKKAFAAASFGQVHRAVLKSGEDVAVKIQYPNLGETIRSDLRSLRMLFQPMRLKRENRYLFDHIDDAEKMFTAEADYRQEARLMTEVRTLFAEKEGIVVPRVYESCSTGRVLTMDHIPGCHLPGFLTTEPGQARRDHFGRLITRAYIRIWFRLRTLYTDLNPGNFFFMDDGRLGLIDYGSHRSLDADAWQSQGLVERAVIEEDEQALDEGLARTCFFDSAGDMEPERLALVRKQIFWQVAPVKKDEPFDFGDKAWFKQGIDLMSEAMRRGYTRYDSLGNWWARSIIGHRTMMYRLRCRINYREIYMAERVHANL